MGLARLLALAAASTLDMAVVEADGVAVVAEHKAESRAQQHHAAKQGVVDLLVHDIAAANASNASLVDVDAARIPKGMSAANFGAFLQLVEQAASRHGAHTGARAEQDDGSGADVRAHGGIEEKHEHWQALTKTTAPTEKEEQSRKCEYEDDTPEWTNNIEDAPNAKAKAHYAVHNIDETMIWTGMGYTCKAYWFHGWCKFVDGWDRYCIEDGKQGKKFRSPEKNCCVCGKGKDLKICPNKYTTPDGEELNKKASAVAIALFLVLS